MKSQRDSGPAGIGPYRSLGDLPASIPEPDPPSSAPVSRTPAEGRLSLYFDGQLSDVVRNDLLRPFRKRALHEALMIAIPTFTAFVTAVILQPVRSLAITLALLALALAGTFYFRHRAEQGAAKWWYVVSYRFRSGLSGFATPDRLVFPALDLSVPWHTVNAVTTVPEGFVLSVGPVLLPIHQSMFEATDDWEHFQALVIRAMEERST